MRTLLYITGVLLDRRLLVGGLFKLQDQTGVPIELSYEELRDEELVVDWLECLCDCWLNDCTKYNSFERQASSIANINLNEKFKQTVALAASQFTTILKTENPVDSACKYIIEKKRIRSQILK